MSEHPQAPGLPDTIELRQAVIEAYRYLQDDLGYFIHTWGNISVRLLDGLLVTPSKVPLSELIPDSLVVVDMTGRVKRGAFNPTSEVEVHRRLMLRRPEFGAIVHSHSAYATAVAVAGKSIPVISDDMAEIIGGPVHCSEYAPAGHHVEIAEKTEAAIGDDAFAVLMGNHGAVTAGTTLDTAVVASQILEKAAMNYLLSQLVGGPRVIPEKLWREEHHRYVHRYGTASDLNSEIGSNGSEAEDA